MAHINLKTSILTSRSFLRTLKDICLLFGFVFFSLSTSAQTILVHPDIDGGFENGADLMENGWRTNTSITGRNQWVCSTGANPGFSDRRCAYVSNNATFPIPPHNYSSSILGAAIHIFRDITVPAGETDITVDFIWIAQGQTSNDLMRIWLVPIDYIPTYGTSITASTDRIQIGGDYFGSNTWVASPTLTIPQNFAGTTFRFVVEWVNDDTTELDPPAGIDDISIVSAVPPPPLNDDPCNAIDLVNNSTCNYQEFTTYGATHTIGVPNPGCGNYAGGDVWFKTVVPASGGLTIDTQDIEITNGAMAVYTGSCNALTLVSCDDNTSSNGLMPLIIRTDLTPGETLYIRFWENGNDNNGTFGICITPPPPPPSNDECGDAISLTVNPTLICNAVTAGSTVYATASPQPDDVVGYPNNDVWFSFIATSNEHQISLLDIIPVSGTDTNLAVGVYRSSSGNCSTLTLVTSNNNDTFNITNLLAGETYYIRVYGWNNRTPSAEVFFNICVGTPVDPPANDLCLNAIQLPVTPVCSYQTFTNAGATGTTGVPNPGCGNYAGGDVWFYVVVDDTGEITVDTQDLDMTDGAMALYRGNNCNNLTLLDCDNNSSANGQMPSITSIGLTPGEIIYIRLWEHGNNNNGTFGICVTSPSPEGVVNAEIICPGEPSEDIFATFACRGTTSLGNTLSGIMQSTDPRALQPLIFISSSDPCGFDAANTSNYSAIDFTVTTTGQYIFTLNTPSPYFDAMGYIVVNDGNFNPGSCATGTWIAGDDDDGPSLNPQIRANLTAGISYRLITTKFAFTNTTHVGPYEWEVSGPPADIDWFTNETGGTAIASGPSFNPINVSGSGLIDTNTPGIYTFWINCPGSNQPRIKAEFIIGKIWRGTVNTDWNNPNNWKPLGIPRSTDCVYIDNTANQPILTYPGPPTPPSPALAKTLNIGNNAFLKLDSGTGMTITDEINVANSGTFLVRNNANLVQLTNVTSNNNTGSITVQRTVPGTISNLDYIYWSSPTEDFNVTNVSPGSNPNRIYKWVPTIAGNGIGNYGNWQQTNETMAIGNGYIIRGLSGTNPTAPALANTTEFIGRAHNGSIQVPIHRGTYVGVDYPGAGNSMATEIDDNWNLVGNPYPSSIDAQRFININGGRIADDSNPSINGTIYLWSHASAPSDVVDDPFYGDFGYNYNANDYIKFNLTGSSPAGFSGYIASGQAFFVLMDDNTPATTDYVLFDNTLRHESYNNNQFYRTEHEPEKHRIWLDLISSNNLANALLIGYVEGATNDIDRLYDGLDLNETSNQFYSIVDNKNLVIQGKALPFAETDIVPLGVVISQSGAYTIAINTLDGLFEASEQDIYLEDTALGVIHNLRLTPYIFHSDAGEFNNRFMLRYTNTTLSVDEETASNLVTITVQDEKHIQVDSQNELIDSILLYDLLGRELVKKQNINHLNYRLQSQGFSGGVYLIEVTLQSGKLKSQKLILKP
ncbi:T9SS type A sorting domain-containing protein [Hanstruepera marina]|uniref:T9SS type A sorting domain-containing protein n=1 Tax=Hanstruepera marina TaxID=2873265 RepID=UPI001CA752DC|nr:T9SS type A sorting domain-containing protein [Hanstruepera marina]